MAFVFDWSSCLSAINNIWQICPKATMNTCHNRSGGRLLLMRAEIFGTFLPVFPVRNIRCIGRISFMKLIFAIKWGIWWKARWWMGIPLRPLFQLFFPFASATANNKLFLINIIGTVDTLLDNLTIYLNTFIWVQHNVLRLPNDFLHAKQTNIENRFTTT